MEPKSEYFQSSENIKSMILEKLKLNPKYFTNLSKSSKILNKLLPSKAKSERIRISKSKGNPNEATCTVKIEPEDREIKKDEPKFKIEIENRYREATISKSYMFPRNCIIPSDPNSSDSLKNCGKYDLHSQNKLKPKAKSANPKVKRESKTSTTRIREKKVKIPVLELNSMKVNKKSASKFAKGQISQRTSPKSNQITSRILCQTDRIEIQPKSKEKPLVKKSMTSIRSKLVSKCITEQKTRNISIAKSSKVQDSSLKPKTKAKKKLKENP